MTWRRSSILETSRRSGRCAVHPDHINTTETMVTTAAVSARTCMIMTALPARARHRHVAARSCVHRANGDSDRRDSEPSMVFTRSRSWARTSACAAPTATDPPVLISRSPRRRHTHSFLRQCAQAFALNPTIRCKRRGERGAACCLRRPIAWLKITPRHLRSATTGTKHADRRTKDRSGLHDRRSGSVERNLRWRPTKSHM